MLQMEQKLFVNKIRSKSNRKCSKWNKKCLPTKFVANQKKGTKKKSWMKIVFNVTCVAFMWIRLDSNWIFWPRVIFYKTLIVICSPRLYVSFGTFIVQIGQLFEAQRVFEKCLEIDKSLLSYRRKMSSISEFFRIF